MKPIIIDKQTGDVLTRNEKGQLVDSNGNVKKGGKLVDPKISSFVDYLLKVEERRGGGPWAVIGEMVKYWKNQNPERYKSFVVEVDRKKETRGDKHGAGKTKNQRYLADIPQDIWYMIVAFYGDKQKINPYDKDFFIKFANKFPEFTVAEKV